MFDLTNVGLTHFGVIHARLASQVGITDFGVCELKSHIFVSCKLESHMSSSCLKVNLSQEDVEVWDHTLKERVATT